MKLTEEIHEIEQKMLLAEERQENVVAVSLMAIGCFALIAFCWLLAWGMK
jgi:hypothetical protein